MQARRTSKKRSAIYEALCNTTAHPSAEQIYTQLKPEIPDLSLGTVYRNLAMFKQDGEIVSVGTVAGLERFDGNTAPHAHFVCTKCTDVIDVPQDELPQDFIRSAEAVIGGEIAAYQLSYYGVCPKCKNSD